jgi:hypothetical protein
MKKKVIYVFAVLAVAVTLFLYSCNDNSQLKIVELKPSVSIEELSDSTFFKDVDYITCDSKNIFASDVYNGRILKFDLQMNYIKSIGSRGNGPEEFACMGGGITVLNDTLYAIDCTGLKTFGTDGKFIRTVKNQNYWIKPNVCCMDESGHIYLSSVTDSLPLVKYDRYLNRQFDFGTRRGDEDEKISGNLYLLNFFNNSILSVKEDEPVLTLYDCQGNVLLDKYIDSNIFNSRLLFRKQEQAKSLRNKQKNTYGLFSSVSSVENRIYLLFTCYDGPDNRPYCNRIVELTFENNDFHLITVYQLPDNWYTAICCVDSKLICYSAIKQEFQIYEL